MSASVEDLAAEVAAHKKRAGDLSADLMRAQKDLGKKDDELKAMGALQADNDQLKAANADLASQLKAANKSLEAAAKKAADDAAKVEAAEKIKEGLAAL